MTSGLGRRMAGGAAWMILAKLVERGLGVVSTLILVRLLLPADFGIVALAASLIALLEVVTALGFDNALIRDQNATRDHYDTAWTLNLMFAAGMAVAMVALAIPAAQFFAEPRLAPVVMALAVVPLLQRAENIGVVAFRKELEFRREFLFVAAKKLAMVCTAVPMAFFFQNYWALVAGTIAGRLVGSAMSYAVHRHRPRFSLARWRDLFSFSRWLLVINVASFVRERYPDLVLGRLVGATGLGLYTVGAEIAQLATSELTAPINRAVFPALSRVAGDQHALRREYLSASGMTWLLALPVAFGIAAIAPVLVPTLLGEKWMAAVGVVSLLAWAGVLQIIQSTTYAVFLATNKLSVPAAIGVCHAVVLMVALPVVGTRMGVEGVLLVILGARMIVTPINMAYLIRISGLAPSALLAILWRPVLAASIMYVVVVKYLGSAIGPASLGVLFAAIALGAVCYVAGVLVLWWVSGRRDGAEQGISNELRRYWPGTR